MCICGFGGVTEGKTPHGRDRHRWEDNVKTYLKEREWEVMDWINLAHLGFCVNTVNELSGFSLLCWVSWYCNSKQQAAPFTVFSAKLDLLHIYYTLSSM